MRIGTRLKYDGKIVYIGVLNDSKLAVADSKNNFSIVDLLTMDTLHKLTLKHADAHTEKKNISFSPDGKYLAFSEKGQSVVRVIDIAKQKLHHSFPTLNNPIETLCFDPSSHYLVAGSITGRVFLWNLFATGQVSRLSSFPEYTPHLFSKPTLNYVSSASFSPSGDLVAAAGYGGSIVITNIHTEVSPKRITPNHVRINSLCFIGEKFLAAGNVEGSIDIIDLRTSQITKHLQTGLGSVNNLAVSRSRSYLFAAGTGHHISLIDLKTQKIIEPDYIRLASKITHLAMAQDDILFAGCEDGTLNVFYPNPIDLLELRINTYSYAQAYELLQRFPLLRESPLAQKLDDIWEMSLKNAINEVENKNSDEALKHLNKFSQVLSKKEAIKELKALITYYNRFEIAVEHENYALAYSIAEKVPLLKKTTPYQTMEKIWDDTFLKAQVYIIKEKSDMLFKLLEPFSRVSSKLCFIQVFLHQSELFLEFTHLINTHDYEKIFEIANNYPCLKEIQSYQKVINSVQELFEKARCYIFSRDYALAELELEELSPVPYMKNSIHELRQLLSLAKKIEEQYQKGDLSSCYRLIDTHEDLLELPLVKELEKEWSKLMQNSEKEALLGKTKEIKLLLGELLRLHSRSQKVGMLLRLSFLTQIKLLVIKHQSHLLQEAVENYISMFGYDTELNNLVLKLRKEKIADIILSPEQEQRRARSLWLQLTKGEIPDTICKNRMDKDSSD